MPNGKVNRGWPADDIFLQRGIWAPRLALGNFKHLVHCRGSNCWGLVFKALPPLPHPKERATAAVQALVRKAVKSNCRTEITSWGRRFLSSSLKLGLLEFERKRSGSTTLNLTLDWAGFSRQHVLWNLDKAKAIILAPSQGQFHSCKEPWELLFRQRFRLPQPSRQRGRPVCLGTHTQQLLSRGA